MPFPKYTYPAVILLFACCIFLTFNRHSKSGIFRHNSEIWADRAGYYAYLPMLFIYQYQVDKLPPDIDRKTGNGFWVDSVSGKIITKYPVGVAILQAPFFFAGHFLATPMGYPANGFSIIYHRIIDIAAVFYLFAGLFFLYLFLSRYVDGITALVTLLILFAGTNLFYYAIFDTGMSHIYSFALFSGFLYLSGRLFEKPGSTRIFISWGVAAGLIVAVRPINIIFLPVCFIFFRPLWEDVKENFSRILMAAGFALIMIVPQLIYWHYMSGKWFMDPYANEGFTNILTPKIVQVLFSPNNGLVLYNPIILLMLAGLWEMRRRYRQAAWLSGAYFLFIIYLFSSWYEWSYGCSFSFRPFTEYYAMFALPLALLAGRKIADKKPLFFIIAALFCLYNLKMIFTWSGCWMNGTWDWQAYAGVVFGNFK